MKDFPQCRFGQLPVPNVTLVSAVLCTRKKAKTQQNWALAPSVIWWHCYLYVPWGDGIA
jgi:hypothetical protein